MSKTISASKLVARSKKLFSSFEFLARKTGLIVRSSAKFTADAFVMVLLQSITSGKGSFNQLVLALELCGIPALSRQALWKRVDANAVRFMMEATRSVLEERWGEEHLIAAKIFGRDC
jgi:hypothetical protein